jgi:hypothetical protein
VWPFMPSVASSRNAKSGVNRPPARKRVSSIYSVLAYALACSLGGTCICGLHLLRCCNPPSFLDAVDVFTHTGLRDRALLATLAYTFAQIETAVSLLTLPSAKRRRFGFGPLGLEFPACAYSGKSSRALDHRSSGH